MEEEPEGDADDVEEELATEVEEVEDDINEDVVEGFASAIVKYDETMLGILVFPCDEALPTNNHMKKVGESSILKS